MSLRMKMTVGIVALLLVGTLATLAFMRLRMLPRFPYMARALPDADYAAMAARPGWRAHQLEVAPGVQLRGLLRMPATPDAPWVVFFNGNSAQVLKEGQQMLDALCATRGWGGAVWAYRGFDSSAGSPAPATLEADGLKALLTLLQERNIKPGSVHVVGFSLGTDIAAAVAAHAPEPPATLTLLAPMTGLYIGERTQLRLHHYLTSQWLQGIRSPVLVVHGTNDATLPVANGRSVAQALGPQARFLELPGLGHYELPMSPAAQDAMATFISQHAAGAGVPPASP